MNLSEHPWNNFCLRATEQAPPRREETGFYALFWYQSEVNNGGHFQYFLNRTHQEEWSLAARTARELQQETLADNLMQAILRWQNTARTAPDIVEEVISEALEQEFAIFDAKFHELEYMLMAALERAVT
ncbi:DUF4375 domain-containing protein [Roseovarius sp. CAU 1744]|uniref:DMP19 family protein n=1 Tax=Roseovarius sp. CAU 1744 TaxID=3140368 RepID=UPI00325AE2B5